MSTCRTENEMRTIRHDALYWSDAMQASIRPVMSKLGTKSRMSSTSASGPECDALAWGHAVDSDTGSSE